MRTLAIGDIHGCYQSLKTLEQFVGFKPGDCIVTLGDYVDRGPDSRSVIQWLIDWNENNQLIALRGNHELMMLAARASTQHKKEWLGHGGDAVLSSYCANRLDDIPEEHWRFLRNGLRSHYETKTHFFVHAGAYADLPLNEQPNYMLYWESFSNPEPHESGLTMVCGHTPQRGGYPLDIGHAICIDTWACGRGWLTCLDVDTRFCWQTNESGQTRNFSLDNRP